MKKILAITYDKFNDIEFVTPLSILKRALHGELEIHYYNPNKEVKHTTGQYGIVNITDIKHKVDFKDYDAIFVLGGVAVNASIRHDQELFKQIHLAQKELNLPVYAICDAPNALYQSGLFEYLDSAYTSFPSQWSEEARQKSNWKNDVSVVSYANGSIVANAAGASTLLGMQMAKNWVSEERYKQLEFEIFGFTKQ
ncbi:DJ-1/PfpI family protein [Mycoplasma corogypsi]|uniref:DJ-1/PfpI family protein n=1 Tax=Mycoplasma corogypsi TaxID=2106 RepID=UPI0038734096